MGIDVVEPGTSVIRNTIDDLEPQIRLFDADGDKLSHVAPADPDGKSAPIDRRMIHVAYAHAEHLHAIAVGVQTGERLVEDLGYAIATVGLGIDAVVDGLIAAIEADRVIRGRNQKPLDPVPASCFQHVVETDDVGRENVVPVVFAGLPAKVHHGIYALGDPQHVGEFGDVRAHEGLAGTQVADRLYIRQSKFVLSGQLGPKKSADAPGSTRHQDRLHAVPSRNIAIEVD